VTPNLTPNERRPLDRERWQARANQTLWKHSVRSEPVGPSVRRANQDEFASGEMTLPDCSVPSHWHDPSRPEARTLRCLNAIVLSSSGISCGMPSRE